MPQSKSSGRSFLRTGRRCACALALAALGARPALAQRVDSIDVRAGQRVRLHAATLPAPGVLAGEVAQLGRDSLWLRDREDLLPRAFALRDVRGVEVSRGRPGYRRRAAYGALGGGLLVGGVAAAAGLGSLCASTAAGQRRGAQQP